MMPKTVSLLPKVATRKSSKVENKSTEISITLPVINGRASSHSTVEVPTDSKTFQFDVDTNIAIKTTTSNSRLRPGYFLKRLLVCLMFILVILFWLEANSLSQQIYMLKSNMVQMNQEIALISENFLAQKLLVEQISQRFDASRKEHRHYKCLVERETQTTPGDESVDNFSNSATDSAETVTWKDEIMESDNASVKIFKKYTTEIEEFDVISETSTESFNDSFVGTIGYDAEEGSLSESQRSPRNKRSDGRGISAVHFRGSIPETVIHDGGLIAPWFHDVNATGPFGLTRFNLTRGNGAVKVSDAGLYYVYAQVYYLTNETVNSFTINLRKTDATVQPLAYCSVNASFQVASSFTDVSCFTSVIRFLKVGDQILLQQRERHRRILMKDGQTFLGLVRLEHEKGSLKM